MITIRERKSDTLHCFYQAIEIRADNGRVYAKGSNDRWYLIVDYSLEETGTDVDKNNNAMGRAYFLSSQDSVWDGEPVVSECSCGTKATRDYSPDVWICNACHAKLQKESSKLTEEKQSCHACYKYKFGEPNQYGFKEFYCEDEIFSFKTKDTMHTYLFDKPMCKGKNFISKNSERKF